MVSGSLGGPPRQGTTMTDSGNSELLGLITRHQTLWSDQLYPSRFIPLSTCFACLERFRIFMSELLHLLCASAVRCGAKNRRGTACQMSCDGKWTVQVARWA